MIFSCIEFNEFGESVSIVRSAVADERFKFSAHVAGVVGVVVCL